METDDITVPIEQHTTVPYYWRARLSNTRIVTDTRGSKVQVTTWPDVTGSVHPEPYGYRSAHELVMTLMDADFAGWRTESLVITTNGGKEAKI